jgi:hypothetical protein
MARASTSARFLEFGTWIALAALFGPTLVDYADHVRAHSWAWYVIVFPFLVAIAAQRLRSANPRPRLAALLLSVAVVVQLIAMATGALRIGRPAAVLAIAAIFLLRGRRVGRILVLLALCVPVPNLLTVRLGEFALPKLARAISAFSSATGRPALALPDGIETASGIVPLVATDVGWTAAALAFGLAWFACDVGRASAIRGLLVATLAAGGGLVIHFLFTLGCYRYASVDAADTFRLVRDVVTYGTLIVAGIVAARVAGTVAVSAPTPAGTRSLA